MKTSFAILTAITVIASLGATACARRGDRQFPTRSGERTGPPELQESAPSPDDDGGQTLGEDEKPDPAKPEDSDPLRQIQGSFRGECVSGKTQDGDAISFDKYFHTHGHAFVLTLVTYRDADCKVRRVAHDLRFTIEANRISTEGDFGVVAIAENDGKKWEMGFVPSGGGDKVALTMNQVTEQFTRLEEPQTPVVTAPARK